MKLDIKADWHAKNKDREREIAALSAQIIDILSFNDMLPSLSDSLLEAIEISITFGENVENDYGYATFELTDGHEIAEGGSSIAKGSISLLELYPYGTSTGTYDYHGTVYQHNVRVNFKAIPISKGSTDYRRLVEDIRELIETSLEYVLPLSIFL